MAPCAHCDKTGVLTDRKAKKFPVRCGLGVRTIYNPVPIYMGDKPGALTVDYGVAYFTLESREEAAQILDMIRTHAPFEGDFTRGLYFKGTNRPSHRHRPPAAAQCRSSPERRACSRGI